MVQQVIFVAAWCALLIRTPPLVRDREQFPLWLVLAMFAGSSTITLVGGGHFIQNIWSVLDISVTLYFCVHLTGLGPVFGRQMRWWSVWMVATIAQMAVFFTLPPIAGVLTAAYMIGAAATAVRLLRWYLADVRDKMLFVALALMMVGDAVTVPFMAVRVWELLWPDPAWLTTAATLLGLARFALLPLGCVLLAVEPVLRAGLYRYHRRRLQPLWRLLRTATPRLGLPPSAISDSWESLHRRIVEIRDAVHYLRDTWATDELIDEANRYAAGRSELAVACWLEVTRRAAVADAPKLHRVLEALPDSAESTMHAEIAWHIRLYRTMNSRAVHTFADRMPTGTDSPARPELTSGYC